MVELVVSFEGRHVECAVALAWAHRAQEPNRTECFSSFVPPMSDDQKRLRISLAQVETTNQLKSIKGLRGKEGADAPS